MLRVPTSYSTYANIVHCPSKHSIIPCCIDNTAFEPMGSVGAAGEKYGMSLRSVLEPNIGIFIFVLILILQFATHYLILPFVLALCVYCLV